MLPRSLFGCILFSFILSTKQALGRERWLERDNRPIYLYPRRFGQEQPAVLQKLRDACPGQVCGNLAGQAVSPLLAAQPECSQQDMADAIIGKKKINCFNLRRNLINCGTDAARQFDATTQANMIAIAQEYRKSEKNTPPVCSELVMYNMRILIFWFRTSLRIRQSFVTLYFVRRHQIIPSWITSYKLKTLPMTQTFSLILPQARASERVNNQILSRLIVEIMLAVVMEPTMAPLGA